MRAQRSVRDAARGLRAVMVIGIAAFASWSHAQDLGLKAAPQASPIALVGGTIHTISGATIENGYVLFEAGKIREIGSGSKTFAQGVERIDVAGQHVYPGLIGSVTRMGIAEIGAVRVTRDFNEAGEVTPEVLAAVAVNPDSTVIPVTRRTGILTVGCFPAGGAIAGRAGVLRLDGWTWEDMTIVRDAGVVVEWPFMRPVSSPVITKPEDEQQKEIDERVAAIHGAFRDAKAYLAARAARAGLPVDLRWEALRGALGPERQPVFVFASDYDQIRAALDFAEAFGLRLVIAGGRDAPLLAERIKARGAMVIVEGTFNFPKRDDSPYDEPFRLPAELHRLGVPFALASGEETPHERNLPFGAGLAVAHGLPKAAALRAITLSAAEALGIERTHGSIEVGKAATLIVTDGDPLEITTSVRRAYIDGRAIDLTSKQEVLAEKYREKYRRLGIIGP